jgi:hypothetical protein
MSAKVPAPTACTLAPAPAAMIRIMINSIMCCEVAQRTLKMIHKAKEITYTVRRPILSDAADHQSGKIPRANRYNAIVRFTKLAFVFRPSMTYGSAGR